MEVHKVSEPEEPEIVLPEGTPLMAVAGMELPEKAVGPALQFLEFCGAFAKVVGKSPSHNTVLKCHFLETCLSNILNRSTGNRKW